MGTRCFRACRVRSWRSMFAMCRVCEQAECGASLLVAYLCMTVLGGRRCGEFVRPRKFGQRWWETRVFPRLSSSRRTSLHPERSRQSAEQLRVLLAEPRKHRMLEEEAMVGAEERNDVEDVDGERVGWSVDGERVGWSVDGERVGDGEG
eukprot:765478-Hanusia_phi.AAC.1